MSEQTLFRRQVLIERDGRLGLVVPWSLPYVQAWAGGLSCWLVAVAISLAQLNYADKISVHGVVQPGARPAAMRAAVNGVVTTVRVTNRQDVAAAEALLVIDKRTHSAAGLPHVQLRIDQLQAQQHALQNESERYRVLREQERRMLASRERGLLVQRETVAEHLAVLGQRVELEEAKRRKLHRLADRDWVSADEVSRTQATLLLAQEARLEQQRRLQALQFEREDLRAARDVQAVETEHRLHGFAEQLLQLDHEIARVSASGEVVMLAPVSGRVEDLLVYPGKQVTPGMPLLTIVPPSDTVHHVEVFLPTVAAGRVRPGMAVRLRYSGYPFQQYGTGLGEVASVSEVNRELGAQPVFRAQVTVLTLPDGIDHTPTGMSVDADILFAAQPLWAWIAQPLTAALARL